MAKKRPTRSRTHKRQAQQRMQGDWVDVRSEGIPDDVQRDITTRTVSVRKDAVDTDSRTIRCTISTENIVSVFDWETRRTIDEVLLNGGFEAATYVPLLDNHQRWSNDDVFGTLDEFQESGNGIDCRISFADMSSRPDSDEHAGRVERAWLRLSQRHQRNLSAGYRVLEYETIEPNKSKRILGRVWTAGDRALRIVTKWILREGSLTPIGADAGATTRSEIKEIEPVNEKLRKYLEQIGLRAEATQTQAWVFYGSLQGQQRTEAGALVDGDMQRFEQPGGESCQTPEGNGESGSGTEGGSDSDGQRSETDANSPAAAQPAPQESQEDPAQVERNRIRNLEGMFDGDAPELLRVAIDDGWSLERALPILQQHRQDSRSPSAGQDVNGGSGGSPGIHRRGFEQDVTVESLQGAFLSQTALNADLANLDHDALSSHEARAMGVPEFLRRDINDDDRQRHMENAHRLNGLDPVRMAEYALIVAGERNIPHAPGDIIQRAISTGAMDPIYSTSFTARMMASFVEQDDTTEGWCSREEVENFQKQERTTMGMVGKLTKHSRGGTADHTDNDATREEFRIARYSQQWTHDEMDAIDGRFGALNAMTPEDMGRAAKQLHQDLVYALLFANPSLLSTGGAVFTAGQGNLGGGALSIPVLEEFLVWFGEQRIKDRPLNLVMRYLLIPQQLQFLAARILGSSEIRDNDAAGRYSLANPIAGKNIKIVSEARLGPGGVVDPDTGMSYTGTSTNFFGVCQPGENGAKTITIASRRGTGGAPVVRMTRLNKGQWGVNFDINRDVGAAALGWRAMKKSTGV